MSTGADKLEMLLDLAHHSDPRKVVIYVAHGRRKEKGTPFLAVPGSLGASWRPFFWRSYVPPCPSRAEEPKAQEPEPEPPELPRQLGPLMALGQRHLRCLQRLRRGRRERREPT